MTLKHKIFRQVLFQFVLSNKYAYVTSPEYHQIYACGSKIEKKSDYTAHVIVSSNLLWFFKLLISVLESYSMF